MKNTYSPNFKLSEFACKCGCGKCIVHPILIERLQRIATHFDSPVFINSGYRCSSHDVAVGGNGLGAHTMGIAADIRVANVPAMEVAKFAQSIGCGGIGIITDKDIHIDIRDLSGYDIAGFVYTNNHWYGNEQTGETYTTFI